MKDPSDMSHAELVAVVETEVAIKAETAMHRLAEMITKKSTKKQFKKKNGTFLFCWTCFNIGMCS